MTCGEGGPPEATGPVALESRTLNGRGVVRNCRPSALTETEGIVKEPVRNGMTT
jgi:hypothetical protein